MDFSVLMSVYYKDNAFYLKDALESISINQTYLPKQIVLVKDGLLSDDLEKVIREFQKKLNNRIELVIVSKNKNEGLAKALNEGLKYCACEWIARMDADDISLSERFEKQVEYINNHPEVSLLGGYISEFNEKIGDCHSIRKVESDYDGIKKMMKSRTPFNHMTVMYKKSEVLSVGGYSENIGKLEDYCLWIDMIENGVVAANLPEVLVNVRIGNGFLERRSDKSEIYEWDKLQEYLLSNKIINRVTSIKNRLYIRGFIYMPGFLKRILYRSVLRR